MLHASFVYDTLQYVRCKSSVTRHLYSLFINLANTLRRHPFAGTIDFVDTDESTLTKGSGEVEPTKWKVTAEKHCGGKDIVAWADGVNSTYGTRHPPASNIAFCKEECDKHDECAGFVLLAYDCDRCGYKAGQCDFWQSGPFYYDSYSLDFRSTCYEKVKPGSETTTESPNATATEAPKIDSASSSCVASPGAAAVVAALAMGAVLAAV